MNLDTLVPCAINTPDLLSVEESGYMIEYFSKRVVKSRMQCEKGVGPWLGHMKEILETETAIVQKLKMYANVRELVAI